HRLSTGASTDVEIALARAPRFHRAEHCPIRAVGTAGRGSSEARNVAPRSLWNKGLRGFSPDHPPRCARPSRHPTLGRFLPPAWSPTRPRATASRGLFVEAHVPTQHPQARQDPRFSRPDAHPGRPRRPARSPGPRPEASLRLIRRVRDRATFEALARARRRRAGPVSLRYITDGSSDPPRVAYAIGRRFGNAVERNQARRRLRASISLDV